MHTPDIAVVALLALVLAAVPAKVAKAQAAKADPALSYHKLANGLQLVIQEDHASPVVAVNMWVHAGGKDENEMLSGYSHYLEHLTARGTLKREPLQDRLDIMHVGGTNSANTYFDRTQYYSVVGKEHFDIALDSLADTMQNAQLPEKGIENERKVVTEELRRFLDNPSTAAYRETFRLAFGAHPYSRPVIGNFATLNGLKRDDFMKYYKKMYAPNKMVLAIAGDISAPEVLRKVEAAFKDFKPNSDDSAHPPLPAGFLGFQEETQRLPLKRAFVNIGYIVPGWRHPDRWPLEVMARILGGGASSRLWQACVERKTLASDASSSNHTLEDLGIVYVSGSPTKTADAWKLEAAMLEEIQRIRDNRVTDEELSRVKRQAHLQYTFDQEEPLNQAQVLGESALYGGLRYELDWLDRLAKVTVADVQEVAKRYLVKENLTVVRTLPEDSAGPTVKDVTACAKLVDAMSGGTIRPKWLDFSKTLFAPIEANTVPPAARKAAVPAAASFPVLKKVLPNGLTVLFKRRPGRPLVSAAFHAHAGSAYDSAGKEGLAQLAKSTLLDGTRTVSQEELARRFDEWGGNYSLAIDRDLFYGQITLAKEDAAKGLAQFGDLLLNPRWDSVAFGKEQGNLIAGLERQADDINAVAGDMWNEAVFKGTAYAHPVWGTIPGVNAVKLKDLEVFWKKYVTPERSVLTVVGDITEAELEHLIVGMGMVGWARGKAVVPEAGPFGAKPLAGKQTKHMDKQQTQVVIGVPAISIKDPDYVPLRLLNNLVGFRCFVDLIYNKPLAYSTGGMPSMLRYQGALSLYIGSAAENTDRVIQELQEKWQDVIDREVPAQELIHMKNRLIGGQAIRDQRAASLAASYGVYEAHGLGYDFYDQQNEQIRAVSAAELQRMARKYLVPERTITVIVGPTVK